MNGISSNQTSIFNYDGENVDKFIKQIIRLLYNKDIDEVVFNDGNKLNLTKNNISIKVM
jgi:hypothetical protein|tara:strand:- start:355 stop:531 length:177 start_codon:yes stop_codon:yes gene_type:complete